MTAGIDFNFSRSIGQLGLVFDFEHVRAQPVRRNKQAHVTNTKAVTSRQTFDRALNIFL